MTAAPAPQPDTGEQAAQARRRYSTDLLDSLFRESVEASRAAYEASTRRTPAAKAAYKALGAVTALALGFLLAVAYQKVVEEQPQRQTARDGLIADIHTRQDRIDGLTGREELLRGQVNSLQAALLNDSTLQRLRTYEAATGLRRVTGDGVTITLGDGPAKADPVTGQADKTARVLFVDLRNVVNELFTDGAEAIAINGQRLTSTSTIRSAGEAILVDFKPLVGPYKIVAIGPGSMATKFSESATADLFRKLVDSKGMSFSVKRSDDLTLPAAANPQLRYAKPVVSGSPSATASPSGGGK
ncbi:DUF881 domain-containing protein [Hamadaea sp. NPDC050747]|uniref:DUF881 domain-containing protein n=1 Tax=Hamadaea sp. NPDC050747 TaxID=3155789 RepID=UPI003404FBFC